MKTYISGNMTGLTLEELQSKFNAAAAYLKSIGLDPVLPFKNGELIPWSIRLLTYGTECDSIFLLSDWLESYESMTEKFYAGVTGKKILFQSKLDAEGLLKEQTEEAVFHITSAIEEVMGMNLKQYFDGRRTPDEHFARMIFSYQCWKAGIPSKVVTLYINRDEATIWRHLRKYPGEYKYNASFREKAKQIDDLLSRQMCPTKQ